jgi:hypothetical protein
MTFIKIFLIGLCVVAINGCGRQIEASNIVIAAMCTDKPNPNVPCKSEETNALFYIPRRFLPDVARDRNEVANDFQLEFDWRDSSAQDYLSMVSPYLANYQKEYKMSFKIGVRSNSESFQQYRDRTYNANGSGYLAQFSDRDAMQKSQQWFEYQGFKMRRLRPESAYQRNITDVLPTDLLFSDGTAVALSCSKDITHQKPVGCFVYDFRFARMRLDYTVALKNEDEIRQIINAVQQLLVHLAIKPREKK